MLELKDKSAPEKVHGATALTPSEWEQLLAGKIGEYLIIGGRPESPDYVSAPWERPDAQRIFDEVVEACDFQAKAGYRVRIVAVA